MIILVPTDHPKARRASIALEDDRDFVCYLRFSQIIVVLYGTSWLIFIGLEKLGPVARGTLKYD